MQHIVFLILYEEIESEMALSRSCKIPLKDMVFEVGGYSFTKNEEPWAHATGYLI